MFNENYLQEHNWGESVVRSPQEQALLLGITPDKLQLFTERVEAAVVTSCTDLEMVQAVVMSALETEGIQISRPEIIVEAAMHNPEIRREALAFAERLMRKHLQ